MKALLNQFAQYELCFGNRFYVNPAGYNIKSTGFTINGFTNVEFRNLSNGISAIHSGWKI